MLKIYYIGSKQHLRAISQKFNGTAILQWVRQIPLNFQ